MAVGDKITASRITALKAKVKAECLRRNVNKSGSPSVASYGSTTYDFTVIPAQGVKALTEHYTKNAVPMNAINSSHPSNTTGGVIQDATVTDMENRVIAHAAIVKGSSTDKTSTTCSAGCTGLCYGTCEGTCVGGCTSCTSCSGCSGCGDACSDGCTSCTSCSGCSGCSGCGSGCATTCSGCSGCSGCGSGCATSCSGSCSGSCTSCQGCSGCSNCTGTCAGCGGTCSGCSGSCYVQCASGCDASCLWSAH